MKLTNFMIETRQALTLIAVVCLLFGSALNASAYKLRDANWRYQGNPIGIAFVICGNDGPAGASKVIRAATSQWAYSGLAIMFDVDACPSPRPANYIDFGGIANTPTSRETDNAFTQGSYASETDLSGCHIRLNMNKQWYLGNDMPAANQHDLFSVALHEFGHCLGLDDVDMSGVVMQGTLGAGLKFRTLTTDDLNGRDAIYGPR